MKLVEDSGIVRTKGVQSRTGFKIEASAKAFAILSNSLYQDKVKAIIRELSTNALDAHIEAGTIGTKFEVHLPTIAKPSFAIRDYGTGMSRDKIESLYTTYFGSDKNDSNDFVGCLGLGSKSPFSYVNSFHVTSYYNGMVYFYVATIVDGIPRIDFHQEAETDEPNGMRIGFNVKPSDINEFHNKAASVYKYFKHKPTVLGGTIHLPETRYALQGNGWAVLDNQPNNSISTMGHIAYPIEAHHFESDNTASAIHPNAPSRYKGGKSGNDNKYTRLLGLGLHLDFEIGELEMTPSREDLQYTDITINSIKARLDIVENELTEQMSKGLANCKNLWEARKFYYNLCYGSSYQMRSVINTVKMEYDGVDVKKDIVFVDNNGKSLVNDLTLKRFSMRGWAPNFRVSVEDNPYSTVIYHDTTFIYQDINQGAIVGCRRFLIDGGDTNKKVLLIQGDTAAKQGFLDLMGFDESYLKNASDLPKTVRSKTGVVKERVFVFEAKNGYYNNDRSHWTGKDVDMSDGGVFAEINRYHIRHKDKTEMAPQKLAEVVNAMTTLGMTVDAVIGVKTVVADKFRNTDDGEWQELFPYLQEKLVEHIKNNKLEQVIEDVRTFRQAGTEVEREKYDNMIGSVKDSDLKAGSDFQKLLKVIRDLKKTFDTHYRGVKSLISLGADLGVEIPNATKVDLVKQIKDIEDSHPVLTFLSKYSTKEEVQIAVRYINQES